VAALAVLPDRILAAAGDYFDGACIFRAFTGVENGPYCSRRRVHLPHRRSGERQAVVLVHGLGTRRRLAKSGAVISPRRFRVYMPPAGYGRTRDRQTFVFCARRSQFVIGFMDALGLKKVDLAAVDGG